MDRWSEESGKEERRALWIEENRKVGGCVTQRIGVAGRVR